MTLAWTDPATQNTQNPLVNDLELRLTDTAGNVFMPYVLTAAVPNIDADISTPVVQAANHVDPVEQIYVAAPAAGHYTLSVSAQGALTGTAQAYSLVVSGAVTPVAKPGPKPVSIESEGANTYAIHGGDFALGTAITLQGPGSQAVTAEAVEVTPTRITFRTTAPLVDGTWWVELTQPDGLASRLRLPVGASAPRGYETWLNTSFSPAELANADLTWWGADADGDGFALLAAYALGANSGTVPADRAPRAHAVEVAGETHLEVSFTRVTNADVAIWVEVADTPAGPWSTLNAAAEVEVPPLGDGTERVRIRDPQVLTGDATRFARVVVDWE